MLFLVVKMEVEVRMTLTFSFKEGTIVLMKDRPLEKGVYI